MRSNTEVSRLIATVIAERVRWDERVQAADRLVKIGTPAVLPLTYALTQDSMGNGLIADILGKIGDNRAVESLIEALKQSSPHLRQQAAKALSRLGDVRAIESLIASFEVEVEDMEDATAYQDAAVALARFGTPALDPLFAALRSDNDNIRAMSAYALGKLGDARAVDALIIALTDEDAAVRSSAAEALGEIGDARAIDAVALCLSDSDRRVRLDAVRALGYLIRGTAFAPLVSALDDPDTGVRCAALRALANSSGSASRDLLLARVNDPDPCIRYDALHAIAKAGDESLIPLLEGIREHDDGRCKAVWVRDAAEYAIAGITKRRGIPL